MESMLKIEILSPSKIVIEVFESKLCISLTAIY